MSFSINRAVVVGYLGSEVEKKYTPGGTAYARFSLATSENYKGQVQTDFHRIVAWGKLGEACAKFLVKGQIAGVEGKIKYSKYQKSGITVYSTEIVADKVSFGPGKELKQEADDIPW